MFCRQTAAVALKIMATAQVVAMAGLHISPALAAAIPFAQDRLVQAEAGATDFNGADSPGRMSQLAPDFNPFDALVSQSAQWGAASGAASSRQISRIAPFELTASADLGIEGATSEPISSGATGFAYTRYNVTFGLDEVHPFRLTGQMSGALLGEVLGRIDGRILFVRLDAESIADDVFMAGDAAISIDLEGLLQPGQYRLLVELSLDGVVSGDATGGASFSGDAQHNVRLILADPSATGIPGDYNENGTVDAADYVVWRDNLNMSVTLPNDSTPGTVVSGDYDVWRTNFGATSGAGIGNAAPEPATWLLAIAISLLMVRARGRRVPLLTCQAVSSMSSTCGVILRETSIKLVTTWSGSGTALLTS